MKLLRFIPALACLAAITASAQPISVDTAERLLHRDFFVFDNGAGRGEWTLEQQAETLARLGYAGIGYTGVEDLEARLAAFEQHGVRVFNLYVGCDISADPPYSDDLKAAIPRLKGTGVALWLFVQGRADDDTKAVQVVSEIADLAAESDVPVALYPHFGFFIADIEHAVRIAEQADRKNLGITFNLCHELRAGNEARFEALLDTALPRLSFVSINGADHEGGWDKLIQPLGHGAFDVEGFLRTLLSKGYDGPIGLQCYAVPGDTMENLQHNIAEWKAMVGRMAEAKP
ncbi:MAG: TIM barrel protein [Candidatus Hydrogenedens sp.]|nr:TIM barrel protein [Candidatus Hydrogenedens sp.]